jgi:hypothetical protein
MALIYRINRKTDEYMDCGYDEIGLAKRKVLRHEIDELRKERAEWRRRHDALAGKNKETT